MSRMSVPSITSLTAVRTLWNPNSPAAPVVSLALGLDFRVSRNLYLEVAVRYIGDFASWNFGYDSEPLLANEGFFGGFSVGLRFGWGR